MPLVTLFVTISTAAQFSAHSITVLLLLLQAEPEAILFKTLIPKLHQMSVPCGVAADLMVQFQSVCVLTLAVCGLWSVTAPMTQRPPQHSGLLFLPHARAQRSSSAMSHRTCGTKFSKFKNYGSSYCTVLHQQ